MLHGPPERARACRAEPQLAVQSRACRAYPTQGVVTVPSSGWRVRNAVGNLRAAVVTRTRPIFGSTCGEREIHRDLFHLAGVPRYVAAAGARPSRAPHRLATPATHAILFIELSIIADRCLPGARSQVRDEAHRWRTRYPLNLACGGMCLCLVHSVPQSCPRVGALSLTSRHPASAFSAFARRSVPWRTPVAIRR